MRKPLYGLLVLVVALAGVWQPTPARAHAHLEDATPGAGTVLATPPARLELLFDEELDDERSRVQVIGPFGQRADRDDLQIAGPRMWISLRDRGPGVYRVRWRAAPAEGHHGPVGESRGDYTFTIQPGLPPSVPQLIASPPVANNGQIVSLMGSGFTPGGDVVLSVGDAADLLALTRADGRGRFALQATLPTDLPFGRQVLQAADAVGHLATESVWVPRGGWPPAVVRLGGEAQLDQVDYEVRVENRSEWALRNGVLRVNVPPATRVLAEGLDQPDGAEGVVEGAQVVWKFAALPSHSILGPFTVSVLTAGLPRQQELTATASVEFAHTWEPVFRGSARSEELPLEVIAR